jgi:hypothetical protein
LPGELLEGKLHEQFLWGGAGNGRGSSAPRQSLTRQLFFKALKQNLTVKTFVGTSENALRIQIWTALIALLLLKWLHHLSKANWSLSNLASMLRLNLFTYRELTQWIDNPMGTPPLIPGPEQLSLALV